MTFGKFVISLVLGAGLLAGQDRGGAGAAIWPGPPSPADELKQYLALTEGQYQQLLQVQKTKNDAQQALWQQISDKQRQLYSLLESGSTDASRIGALMIEVRNLQKQSRGGGSGDLYRSQALAVLNADQRAKLTSLDNALRLQPTAYQAVTLNLLDYPVPEVRPAALPDGEPGFSSGFIGAPGASNAAGERVTR
ncbi:MAG TPA: periplasmic heavy metal sensor [Bryobacteraceae bacterium]|nr:periplasmic heavy metal sensor [Bryobacteraceae bacterium]